MRKLIRTTAAAVALAAALVIVPGPASAIGYEDSLDDCALPAVVRRVRHAPALVHRDGRGLGRSWSRSAPIWAAFDARDAGTIAHNLVGAPAQFAFGRGIGECGASADY